MEKTLGVVTRLVYSTSKNGNTSILKLLNLNEKKVIQLIIDNDGSILQSELSRKQGMTKKCTGQKERENKRIIRLEDKETEPGKY